MGQELDDVKKVLKSLLIVVPHGMSVRDLQRDFQEIEGRAIPFKRFACDDIFQFLRSMPDTLHFFLQNGVPYVYPAITRENAHIMQMVAEQRNLRRKPKAMRKPQPKPEYRKKRWNIQQILEDSGWQQKTFYSNVAKETNAIVPDKKPNDDTFERTNPFQSTGLAQSVTCSKTVTRAKLLALADSINESTNPFEAETLETSWTDDDQKPNDSLYERETNPFHTKSIQLEAEDISSTECQSSSMSIWPSDDSSTALVTPRSFNLLDECINEETDPLLNITQFEFLTILDEFITTTDPFKHVRMEQYESFDVGSTMRILISDIHSPYKFWFQLVESMDELESLMDALRFYEEVAEDEMYFLPEHLRKSGQICVALYGTQWHRARIVDIYEDGTVKVFYLDYGTIGKIFYDEVRLMRSDFAKLLPQVFRGCLDNIRPVAGLWTRWATRCFCNAVDQVKIIAKITGIDAKENIFYVSAIDTRGVMDVTTNDVLVEFGHAAHENVPMMKWKTRHYNERYPTFDMLENGEYPSFEEIGQFEVMGVDFVSYEMSIINDAMIGYSAEI